MEFVFFFMDGGSEAYPEANTNPTVYGAKRTGSVTFTKEVGDKIASYTLFGENDFVFYAGDYIEQSSLCGCVGWNGQWHVACIIPPDRATEAA